MAKRKATKKPSKRKAVDRIEPLRRALNKRRKAELVDLIVELAREDTQTLREMESRLEINLPSPALLETPNGRLQHAASFPAKRDLDSIKQVAVGPVSLRSCWTGFQGSLERNIVRPGRKMLPARFLNPV